MTRKHLMSHALMAATAAAVAWGAGSTAATATEPCDDFGECTVLIEINATDGDIGFHFLFDGDDLNGARMKDPDGALIYKNEAKSTLREQKLTENFAESAEPLCWPDPEADPDDEIVTLEEFLDRWTPGTYTFTGFSDGGEMSEGATELTYDLPAAPQDVDFVGGVISWSAGDDLGECADADRLAGLVASGDLPAHPVNVPVAAWEVVLEPDVDDGDPTGSLKFTLRVAGDIAIKEVDVSADYLASLPDDTPVKVEVGAIGEGDNATFSEEDGFCVNELAGCDDD